MVVGRTQGDDCVTLCLLPSRVSIRSVSQFSRSVVSDSFVDHDGYSVSSKGFLPTIVDIMVSSVQFSRSVVSDSLRPHESQHARPPWPTPTPRVHSNSRPSSQ